MKLIKIEPKDLSSERFSVSEFQRAAEAALPGSVVTVETAGGALKAITIEHEDEGAELELASAAVRLLQIKPEDADDEKALAQRTREEQKKDLLGRLGQILADHEARIAALEIGKNG